ncbi:MAG: acyltransferase [Cyclobacteriaceae bacterium]
MGNEQLRQHLNFTFRHRLRWWYYKRKLKHCGRGIFFDHSIEIMRYPQNISIGEGAVVKEGAKVCSCNKQAQISIGANTTVGYHTYIFASNRIEIGDNCLIAPFVYLVDSDHGIERNQLINKQPNITAPILVGNDVWISTGAKVLKGVRIGDGAVIAAGALVNEDVSPYTIVAGTPAKTVGTRK